MGEKPGKRKQPVTRQRYLIGRLWREGGRYHFSYVTSGRRSLREAEQAGFRLLDMFPDRYYRGEQAVDRGELAPGTRLRLELEPNNE